MLLMHSCYSCFLKGWCERSIHSQKKRNSQNFSSFFFCFFGGVLPPARAGYVRQATRFKATRDTVDVPSRDQQVLDNAVASAIALHLPQTIARDVFTSILNESISFELCVVSGV